MLFVDLQTMKIKKEFNFLNKSKSIDLKEDSSLQVIKTAFSEAVKELIKDGQQPIECCYTIEINPEDNNAADENDIKDFLTYVNIGNSAFFNAILLTEGRKRERRLDVPDRLKALKINMSLVKKALNVQTSIDKFNLIIKYKDLTFILCDEKNIPQETISNE